MPVLYGEHPPIATGATCDLCFTLPGRPCTDHCHTHGWVRGVVCTSCNTTMSLIDRGIRPRTARAPLDALVSYAGRCPDCPPVQVDQLTYRDQFSGVSLTLRVSDEVHAMLAALAAADHRSLNREIGYIVGRAVAARSAPTT